MTININVDLPDNKSEQKGSFEDVSIKLNARKSIDGNVMIFDHIDIDIVMMPEKKKTWVPELMFRHFCFGCQDYGLHIKMLRKQLMQQTEEWNIYQD